MAQHDYNIANQTGLEFRVDLNNALQAIVTDNSGATAPSTTFPGMFWRDTSVSPSVLKKRNDANDAWVTVLTPAGEAISGATTAAAQRSALGLGTAATGYLGALAHQVVQLDGAARLPAVDGSLLLNLPPTSAAPLVKSNYTTPCLIKTGANTLAIAAGTKVNVSGSLVSFAAQTAITIPTLTPGNDYSVWVLPGGTAQAVVDPFSAQASAPAVGAIKIGGFHYGLVAPGTTPAGGSFATSGFNNTGGSKVWTQYDVDRIAGINEYSIWDLQYRSKGEQRGSTFDPQTRTWWGIYLCSTNHIGNGISCYNTDVASGTVLPRIPWPYGGNGTTTYGRLSLYEAQEIAASHFCRLPSYEEFMSAAFGVTEGNSLGGASSTIPVTTRQPGYTSRIGIEQATGHQWIIGAPFGSSAGSAWLGTGRGSLYGTTGLPLFGGARVHGPDAGSRCSNWICSAGDSVWYLGLRAVADHYQGGYY